MKEQALVQRKQSQTMVSGPKGGSVIRLAAKAVHLLSTSIMTTRTLDSSKTAALTRTASELLVQLMSRDAP